MNTVGAKKRRKPNDAAQKQIAPKTGLQPSSSAAMTTKFKL